jgi:hypothetical protein
LAVNSPTLVAGGQFLEVGHDENSIAPTTVGEGLHC